MQMTYAEQVDVRTKWLSKNIQHMPEFGSLSEYEARLVMDKMIHQRPVLEKGEFFQETFDLIDRWQAGDANAQSALLASKVANVTNNNSGVLKFAIGLANRILPTEGGLELEHQLFSNDNQKLQDYISYLINEKSGGFAKFASGASEFVGALAGMGLDFAAAGTGTMRGPTKLLGQTLDKVGTTLAGRLVGKAGGRILPWVIGKAGPTAAQLGGGALVGLVREELLAKNTDPRLFDRVSNNIDEDGNLKVGSIALDYLAMDALFALGVGGIGKVLKSLKMVLGKGRAGDAGQIDKIVAKMDEAQKTEFWKKYSTTGVWDPQLFNELSESQKLMFRSDRLYQDTVVKLNTSAEYLDSSTQARLNFEGTQLGVKSEFLIDGKIRALDLTSKDKIITFPNEKSFGEYLGQKAKQVLDEIDDVDEMAEFAKRHKSLNFALITDEFNDAFTMATRNRDAIPIGKRSGISPGEADDLSKLPDVRTGRYDLQYTDTTYKRLRKNQTAFANNVDLVLDAAQRTPRGNTLVTLKNIADQKTVDVVREQMGLRIPSNADEGLESALSYELVKRGYDGYSLDPKWTPQTAGLPDKVGVLFPEQLKVIDSHIDALGKWSGPSPTPHKGFKKNAISVETQTTATGLPEQVSKQGYVDILASQKGAVNFDEVGKTVRGYLKQGDVTANVKIKPSQDGNVHVKRVGWGTSKGHKIEIEMPKRIDTPEAHRAFLRDTFKGLDEILAEVKPQKTKLRTPDPHLNEIRESKAARFSLGNVADSELQPWIEDIVRRDFQGQFTKTSDGFTISTPNEGVVKVGTLREALDEVLIRTVDEGQLRFELSKNGLKLKTDSNGTLSVVGTNVSGKTPVEIMRQLDFRPEKISSRYGPKMAVVQDGKFAFTINGDGVTGTKREVLKYLDNFRDYKDIEGLETVFSDDLSSIAQTTSNTYRVTIPGAKVVQEFSSLKEARQFVRDWTSPENMDIIATQKGIQWNYHDGKYEFYIEGKKYVADDVDEIQAALAEMPDPEYAPEIVPQQFAAMRDELDLPPGAIATHKPNIITDDLPLASIWKAGGNISTLRGILNYVETTDTALMKSAKQLGDPGLLARYRSLEQSLRRATIDIQAGDALLIDLFSENGKLISYNRRRGIMELLEAGDDAPKWEVQKITKRFDLEDADFDRVRRLREDFYGTNPQSGLYNKFGIDPNIWLTEYQPRIQSWLDAADPDTLNQLTAWEMVQRIYGRNPGDIPRDLKFWAENMRTSEMVDFVRDKDALSLAIRYNHKGHLSHYLGDSWDEMSRYLKANKDRIPGDVVRRIVHSRELMAQVYTSNGERLLKQWGKRFTDALVKRGILSADSADFAATNNILQTLFTLNYIGTMGFRPFLAIRNSTQVWTTLGSRFGNDNVMNGIKRLNKMSDEEVQRFVNLLTNQGVIQGRGPVVEQMLSGVVSTTGKISEKSLSMFRRSDVYTRVVAALTADSVIDEAFKKYPGLLRTDPEKFFVASNLNLVDPDVGRGILEQLKRGDISGAKTNLRRQFANETMFQYVRHNQPYTYTSSIVGRLFGQFGTYSVNYIQNFLRGIKNGTKAQKMAFITRFVGNNMALYGAFTALGLNAQNFLPWSPMQFSGGPIYEMAVNGIASMGSGYKAQQARADFARGITNFAPGLRQLSYVLDAGKYLDRGDWWLAFLALNGSPIRYDLRK